MHVSASVDSYFDIRNARIEIAVGGLELTVTCTGDRSHDFKTNVLFNAAAAAIAVCTRPFCFVPLSFHRFHRSGPQNKHTNALYLPIIPCQIKFRIQLSADRRD